MKWLRPIDGERYIEMNRHRFIDMDRLKETEMDW